MASTNDKRVSFSDQVSASQSVARASSNPSEADGEPSSGEEIPKQSSFSAPTMEAYGTLLQESVEIFQNESEKLYGALNAFEKQEEMNLVELVVKKAETAQLIEHMRNQREAAFAAISELTGPFCNN